MTTLDQIFIGITRNGLTTWVRADQILGIDESPDRVLVRIAYMPPDMWLQSDEPAQVLLERIQMSMEHANGR